MSTIYVRLLDEGTDVWRPVEAVTVAPGVFEIAPGAVVPDDERWEFGPGERVQCRLREDGVLVATSTAAS
jgi:hypothetical protein